MTDRRWDVAVAGAGVAGSALAIGLKRLRPGTRVVVLDRAEPGGRRVGETLPPQAMRLLERLGIAAGFRALGPLPAHGTSAAWGSDELHHNPFVFSGQGHGWHVDRGAFDAWLCEEARSRGATVRTGCEVLGAQRKEPDAWAVQVGDSILEARVLVDATGRRAALRGHLGAQRHAADRLVCAWRSYQGGEARRDSRTLIEAAPYGWWYSAGIPGGGLIVAVMTDSDVARRHRLRDAESWQALVDATRHTAVRAAGLSPTPAPELQAACTQWVEPVCGPGWLAVGDAALAVDPLSSLGMFQALRGGLLGSYAVMDHLDGKPEGAQKYAALIDAELQGYRERRDEVYAEVDRFSAHPFWRRRRGAPPSARVHGAPRAVPSVLPS